MKKLTTLTILLGFTLAGTAIARVSSVEERVTKAMFNSGNHQNISKAACIELGCRITINQGRKWCACINDDPSKGQGSEITN
jgi:hypothetical protein